MTELQDKLNKAQALSDEITKEFDKNVYAYPWYHAPNQPLVIVSHMYTADCAAIDLMEGITKFLVCDRLIDAQQRMLDLGQQTLKKLQQIQEKCNGS